MAAKKSARLGRKTGVRPGDAEKVKWAFTKMMDDYIRMKESQNRFETSAADLVRILWPWSIPRKKVQSWLKELRRR